MDIRHAGIRRIADASDLGTITDGQILKYNSTTKKFAGVSLTIGTDVQAYDADLSAIAALSHANGNFIVSNGSAWTSVGTLGAVAITQTGTSGNGLYVLRDLASGSTDSPLVRFNNTNASDDQTAVEIAQDGSGAILDLKSDGTTVLKIPANMGNGTDGQVLTTDGDGVAAWETVGAAESVAADNITAGNAAVTISTTTGAVNITPASGSAIVLDGAINVDAGVVTGATSITSTAFVGGLTGDVTGTSSKVTVTDNESSNEENLLVFVGNGATATGSQDLEMDGDLSYNPSIGRLTVPLTLQMPDTGAIKLGASQDLKLYHNGSHSYIVDQGTGKLRIQSSEVVIEDTSGANDAVFNTSTGDLTLSNDLILDSDSAAIQFGDGQDVTLTHVAGSGLTLKHTTPTDNKPLLLTLATGETTLVADEPLAKIAFQAPDEASGTDSRLVAAAIQAVVDGGPFSETSNATRLEFMTGSSEDATAKVTITSDGHIVPSTDNTIDLGTSTVEFRNAYFDGTVTSDAFAGGNLVTEALTVQAASGNSGYIYLSADAGEDNSDLWRMSVADGGNFAIASQATGSWVNKMTLTSGTMLLEDALAVAGNASVGGDLTISGDDLFMATNTSGYVLVADGTNYNPVAVSGDATLASNGAVTIANNAVSLAKMAGITRGSIIIGDASGDPAALAIGSNTYVLTSDGTDIAWAAAASGGMSSFQLEDGDGTEVAISNAKEVKFIGSGITTNWTDTSDGSDGDPFDMTFTVDAAQTGITSILATDLKIGEDDQTKIDFETADEIHFYAANVEQVYLGDNIFGPQSDSDVDLGSTGVRWKDAFVDSITVTGEIDGASLDISGNADIDGTLEADAITVNGSTLASVIAGTTVTNATIAANISITDNEDDDENNHIPFIANGDSGVAGGIATINHDGDLHYNPSSGTVTATIFKGNIDAVDGDFDGTLEADAVTVGGVALATYIRDTVGTNMLSSNTESGIAVTYDTSNDNIDFAISAAQTGITSILATDLKIGEDDQTKIDFETADEIHFYAANVEQVYLADNIFGPQSDSDVDLGATGVRWKDAYVDSITVTGEIDGASLDISGNADIDGTLEADAITVGGTALASVIAGTTVVNAAIAAAVAVQSTDTTNENDNITFVRGGPSTFGNVFVGADDDFHYNPSTGTVTATIFKGNVDAVDGDFDGTLEADAITVGGTNIVTGSLITTLGTISAGVWQGTAIASAYIADNAITGAKIALGSDAAGDIMYNNGTDYVRLAKGSDDEVLTLASGVPSWATASSGGMSAFIIEDDDGTEVSVSNAEEIKFIGSGITTNWTNTSDGSDANPFDMTFTVDAAQTGITSILAADLKIGEDDQTKIDFETADEIHFYAANVEQVYLGDNIFGPQSDSDVDLGATGVRWKDAFVDSITVTGEIDGASLDISGNADIDGTLEADAYTVDGVALNEYIADTVGAMVGSNTETNITVTYEDGDNTLDFVIGTLNQDTSGTAAIATTVTITDNEDTNEENAIIFTAGGDVDGGNLGLESDGHLTYNPSSGTVTATIFKGNIDAVDGDFDGTLEADAITVGGTNIVTGSLITTLGTISAGVWQGTAIASAYIADNAITGAKIALGSDAAGDIMYNNGTDYVRLAKGSNDQVLTLASGLPSWEDVSAGGGGDITGVTLAGDSGSAADTSANVDLTIAGGNGITTSGSSTTLTVALDAALTTVTSLLATDIKIGEDDQTKIDFETADEIHFYAANVEQVYLGDNIFGPQSDSDVDLGSTGVRWKDAFVDSITVTGEVDGASLDISGNADIDGTLEADAITVGGTALNTVIAGVTVANATTAAVATTVTITDNESTNEDNAIIFTAGGDVDGGNIGLESDGTLTYNPSSGTVTATIFKGNIDAVDGDFDGTLEADAYTVDGVALATYIRDTVGTNMLSSNTESGITVTYDTSNDNIDFAIDAAQTGITSLLATDIKIGEDDQTKIDFETADEIHFYAANVEQVYLGDNIFGPQSDSDVDLGSTGVRWKDAFVDSITVTGEIDGASLDISGNADIDGTLEADAITVNGSALASVIAGTTVSNATTAAVATTVTITDNESTNEDNAIIFTAGGDVDGGNIGLESDGDLHYNPSTGTVTATIFKGNIDAVDGDFDGTLEADAITVGGTALNTVIAGVTVTNATTAAVATTVTITDNESTNEENAIIFTAGGDVDGGNIGLESDGTMTYNPSTGTVTATIFKGNVDAVDGDFDGTLEADAITVGGTALNTVIAGVTVTNATNAAHVSVADNENTDENNLITFIEGASATGNVGLESDGDFHYNPSSGTVTATIFKGNIDAVDGDFDGTLEADAITVGGTALNTVIAGVTVANATTAAVATTVTITDNESTNEENAIIFTAGGDVDGGNIGLESDGTMTYNPSSGTVTATIFKGNIDAVDGDFDGTLEADAITVGGTNVVTGGLISSLAATVISGLTDVTSTDSDYLLLWDATDSALKKVDAGEFRGGGGGSGDITGVTLAGDSSTAQDLTANVNLTLAGGNGITTAGDGSATISIALDAALTTVTSLLATDIKIGEDDQTKIDFETADEIHFYAANVHEVTLAANELSPNTSDGIALGTGSKMWSDLFLASAGVINFNNGDVTLTHSSNAITVGGGKFSVQHNTGELAEFKRITGAGNAYVTIDASAVNTDEEAQLRLKSGVAGKCRIYFGDTGDNDIGQICYEHADNSLGIKTNNTTAISIDTNQATTFAGSINQGITSATEDATVVIDLSDGNYFNITLGADVTDIDFTNGTDGQRFLIRFTQPGGANHSIAYNAVTHDQDGGGSPAAVTIKWAGGVTHAMTRTNAKADTIGFIINDENAFDAFIVGQNL